MPEDVVNRINTLLDLVMTRLETEVKSAPPAVMQHTAVSVLNLYTLKENLMNAASRSALEEKAIKEFVKSMNGKASGGPVQLP